MCGFIGNGMGGGMKRRRSISSCVVVLLLLFVAVCVGCQTFLSTPFESILPPTDGELGRWVLIEGANNTRDIGGYLTADGHSVKWNTVYRSGSLSHVDASGCETFRELGIRYVIDLRNRLSPLPPFDGDVVCVFQTATVVLRRVVSADDTTQERTYIDTVLANSASYRDIFGDLANPAHFPFLYHCAAGKDRTGIMTALLLTLLGVDRQTVIEDYQLSEFVYPPVNVTALASLLDEVEAAGGIETFLASIGVTGETQAAVRANLLD